MSIKSKIDNLVREIANNSFRTLTSNRVSQPQSNMAKVVSTSGDQYIVILQTGETQLVYAMGSRPIALGETYRLVGDFIF